MTRTRPLYAVLVVAIATCLALVVMCRPPAAARDICAHWRIEKVTPNVTEQQCLAWR